MSGSEAEQGFELLRLLYIGSTVSQNRILEAIPNLLNYLHGSKDGFIHLSKA